jgi:hypothetical protein
MELTSEIAKMILKPLRESGIPPKFGLELFSSGFEDVFYHLEKEYLQDIVKKRGSTFKFVSASFGGGKTHFTYQFREIAWKNNYATCHVTLDSKNIQFNKILNVYQAICEKIQKPLDEEEKIQIFGEMKKPEELGLGNMMKHWYYTKQNEFEITYNDEWKTYLKKYADTIRDFDSIYFGRVIREMFKALIDEDLDKFEELELWFEQDGTPKAKEFGIKKQQETDTFRMLSSLTKLLTDFMGFAGLVIFFDEGERQALRSRDKDRQVNTLRQVIDKCGDQSIPGIMFFYTVPDEAEFLQSSGNAYDAIKQRLQKYFSQDHPMSPNISLEKLVPSDEEQVENLEDVGRKLAHLYEIAYSVSFTNTLEESITNIAKSAKEARYGEVAYRRLFIQSMCEGLDLLYKEVETEITSEMSNNLVKNIGTKLAAEDNETDDESDDKEY